MLSALDIARRLDAGTLSIDALYDEIAATIASREPEIRAFVSVDVEAARAAARSTYGPLAGMPMGVKDNIETGDRATAYGSPIHDGYRPAVDAAVVALGAPCRRRHSRQDGDHGTGGSVVRPAAFCGIAGFKPSFGRLPAVGVKIFSWSLDTVGVFAKGIADVAFGAGALADRDWRVDGEVPTPPRLGFVEPQPWAQADEEMTIALERVRIAAERAGAGGHIDLAATGAYDDAQRTADQARRAFADIQSKVDVLVTPSAPGMAPIGLASTGSSVFNRVWTLMGAPAANVPGLRSAAGLPLGVQTIGAYGDDRKTLKAAHWLEGCLATAASGVAAQ
eukprot:jgi/Tetstr1/465453/TSEL_010137.t1